MNMRFTMDEIDVDVDFIQPVKLTRQKRLVEAQKDLVRHQRQALGYSPNDGILNANR